MVRESTVLLWSSQRARIYLSSTWAQTSHSLGEQKLITNQAGGKIKKSAFIVETKSINVSTESDYVYLPIISDKIRQKKVNTVQFCEKLMKSKHTCCQSNCHDFSGNYMVDLISYQRRLCVVW